MLEYSQSQDNSGDNDDLRRKLKRKSSNRTRTSADTTHTDAIGAASVIGISGSGSSVLRSPSAARGKEVHGNWCCVWSEVMQRTFFYNIETETGQLEVPSELVRIYGASGRDGPGVERLRENMVGVDKHTSADGGCDNVGADCTLVDSQANDMDSTNMTRLGVEGEHIEEMDGLDLTADDLTQDVLSCYKLGPNTTDTTTTATPFSTDAAGSTSNHTSSKTTFLRKQQQLHPSIIDDSPHASMDESQSSLTSTHTHTHHVPLLSYGRPASSSYEVATAFMKKMEDSMSDGTSSEPSWVVSNSSFEDDDGRGGTDGVGSVEETRSQGANDGDGSGIVPCPVCTFHNTGGTAQCQMCGTSLPAAMVGMKYHCTIINNIYTTTIHYCVTSVFININTYYIY